MAEIFVSYTSSDRDWAFWIGQELEKLGHVARVHEWEIAAGGDISRWMEERHDGADHTLCVISEAYLRAPYSSWERRAAQWTATTKRPNFALPVFVESCEAPTLLGPVKRCDLHGLNEDEARARLAEFLKPAAKPIGPVLFPGAKEMGPSRGMQPPRTPILFPGKTDQHGSVTLSNIPINLPLHFLGRDDDLAAIEAVLDRNQGRVVIIALHGLRGVGKSALAAAYAARHRAAYRAIWWVRAETETTMRADLAGLGVRLGWMASDATEEAAVASVLTKLHDDGDGILLVYDNAPNPAEIRKYLPRGAAQIIVTSNAPNWGAIAATIEIKVWPKEVGADYLIARTGRREEREAAMALSEALGGLPLAHEQAAAYCERIGVSLEGYRYRFEAAPVRFMDDRHGASHEYHDGLTVAKTFTLAIDEASKLHPAAEPLIVCAALLAPEAIPLYLFSEARELFGEPLASSLTDDGFDEAIAALRAFALIDRESVADERDPIVTTDCIRLHRLVREVANARCTDDSRQDIRRRLIGALAAILPGEINNPQVWARMRRLEALALPLVGGNDEPPEGAERSTAAVLNALALYCQGPLAAYARARPYYERALAITEKALGADHPDTAIRLNNLGGLLKVQGDLEGARPYYERALAINEKSLGADHPNSATSLNNLGGLLQDQGNLAGAQPYYERALAIREKALGADHPSTAASLNNLGGLLREQGDMVGARPYYERALAIHEKSLGADHPSTATSLNNVGVLLQDQGDLAGARPYYERALAIAEKALGADHPDTATRLNNLGSLLQDQGDLAGARPYFERTLAIMERALGADHPDTASSLNNLSLLLHDQGDLAGARPYCERALAIRERALGVDHPDTALSLNNLGGLLQAQGDLAQARPYYERALAIYEKVLGADHPATARSLNNLGFLLQVQGELVGARPYLERALAIWEKALGPDHPDTATSLNNIGALLASQDDLAGARPYVERALAIRKKALGLDHPDTANSLNNMGALLNRQGDLAAARPYYERALAARQKALGPDHPKTAMSLSDLGGILQAQGDLAGARPYLESALDIFEKTLGIGHRSTQMVARNTCALLDQLKMRKEAAALRKKFGWSN